jgi:Rrf2 family protein
MILSQPSKYGLRAVLYIAKNDPDLVQSKEIADELGIPLQYLAKILHSLSKHGFLESTKGRGGGFKLAHSLEEITLFDVVRTIEGGTFGEGCVLGLAECSDENACPLHKEWSKIKANILTMLNEESVRQLIEDAPPTRKDL